MVREDQLIHELQGFHHGRVHHQAPSNQEVLGVHEYQTGRQVQVLQILQKVLSYLVVREVLGFRGVHELR